MEPLCPYVFAFSSSFLAHKNEALMSLLAVKNGVLEAVIFAIYRLYELKARKSNI